MFETALESRPQTVALIGLGPSLHEFITERSRKGTPHKVDEVWGINTAARSIRCDKVWMMDDLRRLEKRFPEWTHELARIDAPIMTCRAYPDYPTSIEYPIDAVLNDIQDDLFTTTVAYAIAYAIHIKVEELWIYGCDFWYPHGNVMEHGIGGASYLLGMAKERGINFKIPNTSTLLDSNMVDMREDKTVGRPLYGYDYNPQEVQESLKKKRAIPALTPQQADVLATHAYKPASMEAFEAIKAQQKKDKKDTQMRRRKVKEPAHEQADDCSDLILESK